MSPTRTAVRTRPSPYPPATHLSQRRQTAPLPRVPPGCESALEVAHTWRYCSDTNPHAPFPVHPWKPPLLPLSCEHLPPYPIIRSPALLARARRHISLVRLAGVAPTSRVGNVRRELESNKAFELIGDSYLKSFVLDMLMDRYPDLTVSSLAKLITSLVANATISWIAWYYGVFGADRKDAAGNVKERSVWDTQNTSADLFEAYLGALVRDGGTDVARAWISEVYSEEVFFTLRSEVVKERDEEHSRLTAPSQPKH